MFTLPNLTDGGSPFDMTGYATDFYAADVHGGSTIGEWQAVNADVSTANSLANGVCTLTNNADTEGQLLGKGLPFRLSWDKALVWGARINIQDFDGMNWFAGLSIADSTIIAGLPADIIGFLNTEDDGTIDTVTRKDGTSTTGEQADHAITADGQWRDLKFAWDGRGRLKFYINGAFTQLYSTNIPTDVQMKLTFAVEAAAQKTMQIDWTYAYQVR